MGLDYGVRIFGVVFYVLCLDRVILTLVLPDDVPFVLYDVYAGLVVFAGCVTVMFVCGVCLWVWNRDRLRGHVQVVVHLTEDAASSYAYVGGGVGLGSGVRLAGF